MTVKPINTLKTDVANDIGTNGTGAITGEILQENLLDIIDSVRNIDGTDLDYFSGGDLQTMWTELDDYLPNVLENVADDPTPVLGGTLDGNGNSIEEYISTIRTLTDTTYTLLLTDAGKVLTFDNESPITVTMPNSFPAGWACACYQIGEGAITFDAAASGAMFNRSSHVKTAGQYASVGIQVIANSGGAAAIYILSGDTAEA